MPSARLQMSFKPHVSFFLWIFFFFLRLLLQAYMIAAVSTFRLDVLLGWRFLLIKTRQKLWYRHFFFIFIFFWLWGKYLSHLQFFLQTAEMHWMWKIEKSPLNPINGVEKRLNRPRGPDHCRFIEKEVRGFQVGNIFLWLFISRCIIEAFSHNIP